MGNTFRVNCRRVTLWLASLIIIGVIVLLIDTQWLQLYPAFILQNYSNIILTMWQVQATIATITIASTAFIIGRIDTTYYGISIKNLLFISRFHPEIGLSFWETIVFSTIWIFFNFLSTVFNNVALSAYMLLITIASTSTVIIECLNVITKSKVYENFAEKMIREIKTIVLANTYKLEFYNNQDRKETGWLPSEKQAFARHQFDEIISNLDVEIALKIKSKTFIFDDPTIQFFFKTMREFSEKDESQFNIYMNNIVSKWISLALEDGYFSIISYLVNTSYKYSINHTTQNLELFLNRYYSSTLSPNASAGVFERFYDSISLGLFDYSDFSLTMFRYAILNIDVVVFSSTLKSVVFSRMYNRKESSSKLILIVLVYLYYVTFKEKELKTKSVGNVKTYNLLGQPIYEKYINDIPRIYTLRDLAKDLGNLFISFHNVLDFFANGKHDWEYIPLGIAKWLHLEHDVVEFFAFYSILNFKTRNIDAFNYLSIDTLSQMFNYLDIHGNLKEEYTTSYINFYKWLVGTEHDDPSCINCLTLYEALNQLIKRKLFEEAHSNMNEHFARAKSMQLLKNEVVLALKNSAIYLPTIAINTAANKFQHTELLNVSDWLNDQIVFGFGESIQTMIEYTIYSNMSFTLAEEIVPRAYPNPDTLIVAFIDLFKKYDSLGIHIDTSFNYDVVSELEFYDYLVSEKAYLDNIKDRLKKRSSLAQNYAQTIYIDSNAAQLGFTIDENTFMVVNENLPKEYFLEYVKKYENNGKYIYTLDNNETHIVFDKDELVEYLACSTFEVVFSANYILPQEKCGFIANPPNQD